MVSLRFATGIALELLAAVLTWRSGQSYAWMLYVIGAGVAFLAGAIVIATSGAPRAVKVIAFVWPVGLAAAIALVGRGREWYLRATSEPETYLFPQGFVGRAVIYFGHPAGSPPEYEDGRRSYRFGTDGVVRTKLTLTESRARLRPEASYYFVAPDGARTPIVVLDLADENLPRDRVGVIVLGYAYDHDEVHERDFIISTLADMKRWLDTPIPPR